MGIFDFFKNKKSVEVDIESVAFGDIENWLGNRTKSFKVDEAKALGEIGRRLEDFFVSVEEKLWVLEGIDIESKKEHGRAKLLVRQGLDKYINFVRVLLKDLGELERNSLEEFTREVGKLFNHFEKKSAKFYARATYLVGDEIAAVRNEIRRFYNEIVGLVEGSLVGDLGKVGNIKLKLEEFEKVGNVFDEIEKGIGVNDLKIEKDRGTVKKLGAGVEDIRASSEHVSNLKMRDEIKMLEDELNNEIGKLKGLVDFKRLIGIVHSNERELGIVKNYRNHFVLEFSKDKGKRLFDLMAGSNMKNSAIDVQVDLIKKKNVALSEKRDGIGVDYTVAKLKEISGIEEEIENIELDNIKNYRRLGGLKIKLKELKNEIVGLVEEFGVIVG